MASALSEKLDEIQNNASINAREVAQLLKTRPETVSRWRGGASEPQPTTRDMLLQLWWLTTQLAELYVPSDAHMWLFAPHKQLNGERPVDLIQRGQIETVLKIISQLRDGAHV
jgi:transcriptional regulator with XRE-family HTH domain